METSRRDFLKIIAGVTGSILCASPAALFGGGMDKETEEQTRQTGSNITVAMGLGYACLGPSFQHINKTVPCFNNGILADVSVTFPDEYFKIKSGFPDSLNEMPMAVNSDHFVSCVFSKNTGLMKSVGKMARVESRFIYPDGRNAMTMIFPKAEAIEHVVEEDNELFVFRAKKINHKAWDGCEYGKFLFGMI